MLASLPAPLLLLALLAGTATAEPSHLLECETQRIELSAEPAGKVPEVCVTPGVATNLVFDSPLLPGSVVLEADARGVLVEPGQRIVTLLPAEGLVPGERLKLTVRFADDAAPASATFLLVVHPARAERQVGVFRQKRTLESYQQEVRDKDLELQQCREENERLRAEEGGPGGLTGLLASGLMDQQGIAFRDIARSVTWRSGNGLDLHRVYSYRAANRVAVELGLEVAADAKPWAVAGAKLLGAAGRELRVLWVWPPGSLLSGSPGRARVVIEAEATEEEAQGPFTLKLWGADGTRSIVLTGVTFP